MTVLIVGAGPTGLTLGCELARRGVDCRIVDRAPGLFPGSRGKGLQPRTLEVFDDLGVLTAVLARGGPFPPFRLYNGTDVVSERTVHEMLGLPAPTRTSATPYPQPWLLPQWRTDEILYERFEELGGKVEFGTALVDLDQDADAVSATLDRGGITERVRADHLVGADGGHSTVRTQLGVGFSGTSYETERTLVGDLRATGLDGDACHILTRDGDVTSRFSLWTLPHSPYYQIVASMTGDDETPELTVEAVQRLLEQRTGRTDVRLSDARWLSLHRVGMRMVDRFRVGRVLLAGDAAHVHSSAGGQGLNTSVQDAYNLGWKLAAVHDGADDALLDTYDAERLPVAARLLGDSDLLHRRNFRPSTAGDTPQIHQLDITYRDGPLAVDDRPAPGLLRAGDRAPDGLLADGTRLFDAFRGPHATLLRIGRPIEGYDVEPGTLVLVRPDGHVGVISTSERTVEDHRRRLGGPVVATVAV